MSSGKPKTETENTNVLTTEFGEQEEEMKGYTQVSPPYWHLILSTL